MTDKQLDINTLFSLTGKVALVTGGSRGIGRMISQGFLQAGAKVYITARKAEACLQAAAELCAYGECIAIPSDVTDEDARRAICDQIGAENGQLDILVNNAGVAWGAPYETYPQSAFDRVMSVNVASIFALTRDAPRCLKQALPSETLRE